MKLHKPTIQRIARSGGGLFFGLLFHFPCHISDHVEELEGSEYEHYDRVSLVVGLIAWRLTFELSYNHRRHEAWRDYEP